MDAHHQAAAEIKRAESPFRTSGAVITGGAGGQGAQTARGPAPPSLYQQMHYDRTTSHIMPQRPGYQRGGRRTAQTARGPERNNVSNRASTPRYVLNSIPGYQGFLPGKQFLHGGTTHRGETEVLHYSGTPFQPLRPRDMPRPPPPNRFIKDTGLPGYAGHVQGQRYSCGNFRVDGFESQYKGEVHRSPFHSNPRDFEFRSENNFRTYMNSR